MQLLNSELSPLPPPVSEGNSSQRDGNTFAATHRKHGLAAAWLLCVAAGLPFPIPAQTNSSTVAPLANRYLLIFETSHAMGQRSAGVMRTFQSLIVSRMGGRLRTGDSIALWTFSDTLHTGLLPLQEWSTGGGNAVADRLATCLRDQKFEKQARLDQVIPALLRVVRNSQFITIVLVTEGAQEMHGTPFDQQINQSYKLWSTQQQEARMPFVTILQAAHGTFTYYNVAPVPWPLDFPPLPAELLKQKLPPNPTVVSAPTPKPPPMAPPLILSGRKPQPVPVMPAPSTTNSSVALQPPAPVTNSEPATQVAQSKAAPDAASPVQTSLASTPSTGGSSSPSAPVTQAPAADVTPKAVVPSQPVATPPTPATLASAPKPAADVPATNVAGAGNDKPGPTSGVTAVPQPQVATVPVGAASSQVKWIVLAVGVACLFGAVGFWLWKRRTQPAAHVSLITRSLDRDKP